MLENSTSLNKINNKLRDRLKFKIQIVTNSFVKFIIHFLKNYKNTSK